MTTIHTRQLQQYIQLQQYTQLTTIHSRNLYTQDTCEDKRLRDVTPCSHGDMY